MSGKPDGYRRWIGTLENPRRGSKLPLPGAEGANALEMQTALRGRISQAKGQRRRRALLLQARCSDWLGFGESARPAPLFLPTARRGTSLSYKNYFSFLFPLFPSSFRRLPRGGKKDVVICQRCPEFH